MLGVTALGYYQMAFNIGNFPSSEITGVISKVAFPAYVKLKTASQQLKFPYLKNISLVILMSAPLTGGIIILSEKFTSLFLGEKWLPIVSPLQILALCGMLRSIAGTGGPIFYAIGKPGLDFKKDLCRLTVIVVTIYPLTKIWGISGTSFSVLLGMIMSCAFWLYASIKEIKISLVECLQVILPPITGSVCMCIILKSFLNIAAVLKNQFLIFSAAIVIGILSYVSLMLLIELKLNYKGLKWLRKTLYEFGVKPN
jgi:O-antigen/teichoic acid export membrane protein